MNPGINKSPDPHDATRCDMCGQRQESVRPRTVNTVGKNSGTVRTKFCDYCAAVVTKWLKGEDTIERPPEETITVATDKPLTPAQVEQVTQSLVDGEAERDLPRLVEKYRAIEKQSGKRVQVCIADYDETTYNFLHLGEEWTHDFWRMVNYATARKLREVGFRVRFVSLDLDDYMAWLARENLHDSSTARAQFAAAKADCEMGIKSAVPVPISEPRGETPTRQASADMQCDIRRRDRWTRLTKTTAMTVAVVALAAFVGGHNSHAPNHPSNIAVARSPEVRHAIPVEPEIRKAIPVRQFRARTREEDQSRATEVRYVFVSSKTREERQEQYLAFLKQPKDFVWRTAFFFLAKLWLHLDNVRLKSEMEELKRKTLMDEAGRARQIIQALTGGRNLGLQISKQMLKDRVDSRKTGSGESKG